MRKAEDNVWKSEESFPGIILTRARTYAHNDYPGGVASTRHPRRNRRSEWYKDSEESKQIRSLKSMLMVLFCFRSVFPIMLIP